MSKPNFQDKLIDFCDERGYSGAQLARLSGLPRRTVANWLEGRTNQPRYVEDILKLADALRLNRKETDMLLSAANFPMLIVLIQEPPSTEVASLLHDRGKQVPFQVPARIPYFVGRQQELATIHTTLMDEHKQCIVQGMGGIGKTALVVQFVHKYYADFPDGVIWIAATQTDIEASLNAIGLAYGHDLTLYDNQQNKAGAVRSLLASKHALLILDDVQDSEMLRQLTPGGNCAVLSTTRRRSLSASIGVTQIDLLPLTQDSSALIAGFIGKDQLATHTATIAQMAEALGHLPLALTIAAARIAYEPAWSVPTFWRKLRTQMNQLDMLNYDDRSVRLTLQVSYDALNTDEKAVFEALSVFGNHSFSIEWATSVTDVEGTDDVLRRLYALSLLQYPRDDRYQLHPLIALFVQEKHKNDHTTNQLVRFAVEYITRGESYTHIDQDYPHLHTALVNAHPDARFKLVHGLFPYWEARGLLAQNKHWFIETMDEVDGDQRASLHVLLGRLAMQQGDFSSVDVHLKQALTSDNVRIQSQVFNGLGVLSLKQGHYEQAVQYIRQSLALVEAEQHYEGVISCWINLGSIAFEQASYHDALHYYQQGLEVVSQIPQMVRETPPIVALHGLLSMNMGAVQGRIGDLEAEMQAYQQSLKLAQSINHRELIATLHTNLAELSAEKHDLKSAIAHTEQALKIARETGDRENLTIALIALGDYARRQDNMDDAQLWLLEGLNEARSMGNRHLALRARLCLGDWYLQNQQISKARECFEIVLRDDIERPEDEAAAHYGLAKVAHAIGELADAHERATRSLNIYERISSSKAESVRRWITESLA